MLSCIQTEGGGPALECQPEPTRDIMRAVLVLVLVKLSTCTVASDPRPSRLSNSMSSNGPLDGLTRTT